MPELELKYELNTNQFIKIQKLEFENYEVDLRKDQCSDNPNVFKSKDPYTVIPDDNYIHVYLLANASKDRDTFKWSLNIWIDDKLITEKPIEAGINTGGRADYNGKIKWC